MNRTVAIAAGLLGALLLAAPVSAGPLYTGDTELQGVATSGTTLLVEVSVTSEGPVVPYEFQIQNECQLPNRGGRTVQRDNIVEWVYEEDAAPHTLMPVHLQAIPAGSKCKVFLARGNVQLKGSVTSFTVAPAP
jgi:hypothetical protein